MLDADQKERYERDGCMVIEDVVDAATVRGLRAAIDELVEGARAITDNDALYDLEDDHAPELPRVRRLKDPDRAHPAFEALRAHPGIIAVLEALWGTGVRFDKAKLNMKMPGGGAAVEWHQDWAFYPHTNDDLAAVGIMIDDMDIENGPLMIAPGSHRGPVLDHHADGAFCGAVDVAAAGVDLSNAIALTGPAGSITVHHVRALHGSAPNRSNRPRRLLLHQYCAADAWPLMGVSDYAAWSAGLVSGEETRRPRMAPVPVSIPLPAAPNQGSIYENQRTLESRYFTP